MCSYFYNLQEPRVEAFATYQSPLDQAIPTNDVGAALNNLLGEGISLVCT